jgi:hypothetical protein
VVERKNKMNPAENDIEKQIRDLRTQASAELDEKMHHKFQEALAKEKTTKALQKPNIWRTIMHSRITKFATAAVITIATVLGITFISQSLPAAYAIEQTIAAYNNIHFLHIKVFRDNLEEPSEFWIKSDEQGRVTKARYYLPVTEDGIKLITWTPERAEIWFKSKNSFLICKASSVEDWMQNIIEQCQPKPVMQKLLEDQIAGKVDVDIQKPQTKQEPILIIATSKIKPKKDIYYINQATDLITSIDSYNVRNGQEELVSTMEFYDYNVPIDEKMFSIEDEVPEDITAVNYFDQLIGTPQGDMTDEQAAAETVRQFFQALIDKDYKKAGLIFSGISEEKAKEYFSKLNVTSIISIGTPTPYPKCGPHSFRVPCELEITTPDGKKTSWKPYGPFTRRGDDEMHPDRWIIHGGI